ncbi:MAG: DUF4142 domain-containing protein [Acidobacteria bacterium]|nr:MAG: DUF4142 domain-containing protein [Acidobacteriota bacterium]
MRLGVLLILAVCGVAVWAQNAATWRRPERQRASVAGERRSTTARPTGGRLQQEGAVPQPPVPTPTVSSRLLRMNASNEALLQVAQIGEKRGATTVVRRYARRVTLDHRKVKAMLQEEAERLGINLRSAPQPELRQLESAAPTEFDHLFLQTMAAKDQAFIPELNQSARQPATRSLQLLTHNLVALVRIHLTLAQELLKPGAPV